MPAIRTMRHQFGTWQINTYGGVDVVFDLQDVESTQSNGTPCTHGGGVPRLCSEWSQDGGHLNDTGSTHGAKALLYAIHRAATS